VAQRRIAMPGRPFRPARETRTGLSRGEADRGRRVSPRDLGESGRRARAVAARVLAVPVRLVTALVSGLAGVPGGALAGG